mmetsp:Transcript_96866/g.172399  ORF Transcript_96866/g.172399 Transcript_96866/m.172399 type:complete len:172 (+) Transcript_96866:668-1183(+)
MRDVVLGVEGVPSVALGVLVPTMAGLMEAAARTLGVLFGGVRMEKTRGVAKRGVAPTPLPRLLRLPTLSLGVAAEALCSEPNGSPGSIGRCGLVAMPLGELAGVDCAEELAEEPCNEEVVESRAGLGSAYPSWAPSACMMAPSCVGVPRMVQLPGSFRSCKVASIGSSLRF